MLPTNLLSYDVEITGMLLAPHQCKSMQCSRHCVALLRNLSAIQMFLISSIQ